MRRHLQSLLTLVLASTTLSCALLPGKWHGAYRPQAANLAAREWFADARFGLFIHWGPYALEGEGADLMEKRGMTAAQYAELAGRFDPGKFDPGQWAGLTKFSGARYITFTAKNADGFALFDSRHSDFDVMDASPFKRNAAAELAKACDRQGLRLFYYYSQLDWHHPDYDPPGRTGGAAGRPGHGRWSRYLDDQNNQIRELLTGHAEVAGIWLDGAADKPGADWKFRNTYNLVHGLRPAALVGNNHHGPPNGGEDFIIFDRTPPGATGYADMPLEFAEPIGESWGYDKSDSDRYKSTREILHHMIRAAGANANYLLGVSPDGDGVIPEGQVRRLREVGNWLEIYGPSIFSTRGGPLPTAEWGATTHQDRKIYIHYLSDKGGLLRFTSRIGEIDTAYLFSTGASMDFTREEDEYVFEIPERILDPVDTIIVLEMEAPEK